MFRTENLQPPKSGAKVVLDTDCYNEVDDQFALSYLLRSPELTVEAIYAAPFFNERVKSAKEGMEKSYDEILHILSLNQKEELRSIVFKGSETFLTGSERKPVAASSAAASDLAKRAMQYTEENPLYVIAIGAMTNIASALLINPAIANRIVLVWLGGNAYNQVNPKEFNLMEDILSVRIAMKKVKYFIQLPCAGVVSEFRTTVAELDRHLKRETDLTKYLVDFFEQREREFGNGKIWSHAIYDVAAVAWLLNGDGKFMQEKTVRMALPEESCFYEKRTLSKKMTYVTRIRRDALMNDLFEKLKK